MAEIYFRRRAAGGFWLLCVVRMSRPGDVERGARALLLMMQGRLEMMWIVAQVFDMENAQHFASI